MAPVSASHPDSSSHTPPISVVICTRDRPVALQRCLAALARLDYPAFEIVVVDNASASSATATLVAESGHTYIREERPGLDWARNRGLAMARHALIAYTDDDVEVDPAWLRGLAAAFADPQVAAVTGRVLPAELATEPQRLFERYSGMSKGDVPRLFQRSMLREHQLLAVHECGVGANMAFRRAALESLGGFDTALGVGTASFGGDDLDMFHRLLVADLTLCYAPDALVFHYHRRDLTALRRQIYSNGRAFGVYLLKIWRDQTVVRRATALYAARWLGGWLLRRLAQRVIGRLDFPLGLVWAELLGACHAPAAFHATYRQDQRVRANIAVSEAASARHL